MSVPNDIVPVKARGGRRFSTTPLRQAPRRGEARPTPVVYVVADPARATLSPPDGNPETTWISLGQPTGLETEIGATTTRHQFPYGPVAGPEFFRSLPGLWDYPLNAHNLASQIVPESAGRGATDPKRAGSDLTARIFSVKTWSLEGTIQGQALSETWAAGNILNGEPGTASETVLGAGLGREMAPTGINYTIDLEEPELLITISLTWPYGTTSAGGWTARFSHLGGGLDPTSGDLILMPSLRGSILIRERDSEGDLVTEFSAVISPARVITGGVMRDVEPLPLTLCGYRLTGHVSAERLGDVSGSIDIAASEFWGAGEWPA